MNGGSDQTEITVTMDGDTADWLAAKINDSQPALRNVAEAILRKAALLMQDEVGLRRCDCSALDRLADEQNSPIRYDAVTHEFNLLRDTPHGCAEHRIRYCIWCGGKAPESRRDQLFVKLQHDEVERLTLLCASIRTFTDATAAFGVPDRDYASGRISISTTEAGAEEWAPQRVITYDDLSQTALVHFTQRVGDLVSVSFTGKYLGRPTA